MWFSGKSTKYFVFNRKLGCIQAARHRLFAMSASTVTIQEGSASMQYDRKETVFYNKVQVYNRDLSIQVINYYAEVREQEKMQKYENKLKTYNELKDELKANKKPPYEYSKGITVLDALAATGLRSVRYCKEIPLVRQVTINDLDHNATIVAGQNCKNNGVPDNMYKINTGDACHLMYTAARDITKQYDVIDLDPYGSVIPFLDAAVQAVSDGGLMCVTCTDMAVLAGKYPEVCYSKYGSMPLKAAYCHEMSLRILLHSIEAAANKYGRHIEPWISLSIDFYVRVFIRVHDSPAQVKNSCLKNILVYQSTQCPSFYIQPIGKTNKELEKNNSHTYVASTVTLPSKCTETGGNLKMGGPFWGDYIHKQDVVDAILRRISAEESSFPFPIATIKRMRAMLSSISEELKDVVFYYKIDDLASTIGVAVPPKHLIHAILTKYGYRFSEFHHEPNSIKTNAPQQFVWDFMREYSKIKPPHYLNSNDEHPNHRTSRLILANPVIHTIDLKYDSITEKSRKDKKAARFLPNPESHWGPKRKAGKTKAIDMDKAGSDRGDQPIDMDKMFEDETQPKKSRS